MNEKSSISALKGVGEKTEQMFQKLNIRRIDDLIRYYPARYEIFEEPVPISEAKEGKTCTVAGTVFGRIQVSAGKRLQVTTLHLKDITGTLKAIWFRVLSLSKTPRRGGLFCL